LEINIDWNVTDAIGWLERPSVMIPTQYYAVFS